MMSNTMCFAICILFLLLSDPAQGFGGRYMTKKSKCLNPPRTARRVESFISECQEEVKNKLINEAYQLLKQEVAQQQSPASPAIDTKMRRPMPMPTNSNSNSNSNNNEQAAESFNVPYIFLSDLPQSAQHQNYDMDLDMNMGMGMGMGVDMESYDGMAWQTRRTGQRVAPRRMDAMMVAPTTMVTTLYHPTLVPLEDKRIAGCLLHCVYAKNKAIDQFGWPTLDGLVDFYSEGVNEHGFFMATLRSVNLCLRAVTTKYRVDRTKLPQKGESCDLAFDVFDCISDQITGYCLDHYK